MFWKAYPYVYIVLGVLVISGYIVVHYLRMCRGVLEVEEGVTKDLDLESSVDFNKCKEIS